MIINDLDGYYIVFDTKNWNTELDTLFICANVCTLYATCLRTHIIKHMIISVICTNMRKGNKFKSGEDASHTDGGNSGI